MKECPVCKSRYDTTMIICPQDNTSLNDILVTTYPNPESANRRQQEMLKELQQRLKTSALHNDLKGLREGYIELANYYLGQNQLNHALIYFHKAELIEAGDINTTQLPFMVEIYLQQDRTDKALELASRIAQLYSQANQRDQASEYFQRLIVTRSSDTKWVWDVLAIIEQSGLSIDQPNVIEEEKVAAKLVAVEAPSIAVEVTLGTDQTEADSLTLDSLVELDISHSVEPLPLAPMGVSSTITAQPGETVAQSPNTHKRPAIETTHGVHANSPTGNPTSENRALTSSDEYRAFTTTNEYRPLTVTAERRALTPTGERRVLSTSSEHRTHNTTGEHPPAMSRPSGSFRTTGDLSKLTFSEQTAMVIEDDQDVRELLADMLAEFGCRVVTAIDGEDAIEKLKDVHPSFIISDVMMPRLDGYGIFQYIQNNEQLSDIPFIFLTARVEIDEKIRALEGGVEDYWLKPFDVEELGIRLRRLLQKVRLAGDVRGKLSEMPLPDLLQSLASGNKSGVLHLARSGRTGVIYLDQGRIIDAEFEDLAGKRGIYCLVNWCMEGGNFNFHSQKVDREVAIKQSIQGILMEAMRRRDEETRLIEQLPPGDVFMSVNTEDNPDFFSADFSDETMRILQLFDGTHPLKECLRCLQGDLETIQTVVALNKAGLLRIVDFGIQ
ncbi:MAG: response regulator [Acidobacteriota bacterium]